MRLHIRTPVTSFTHTTRVFLFPAYEHKPEHGHGWDTHSDPPTGVQSCPRPDSTKREVVTVKTPRIDDLGSLRTTPDLDPPVRSYTDETDRGGHERRGCGGVETSD